MAQESAGGSRRGGAEGRAAEVVAERWSQWRRGLGGGDEVELVEVVEERWRRSGGEEEERWSCVGDRWRRSRPAAGGEHDEQR